MPTDFQDSHATDILAFRLRSEAERRRQYPFPVGPRKLADTLIEFATGGSWWLEDFDANTQFKAAPGRVFVVPAEHAHSLRMVKGRPMRTRWALIGLEDEIGRDLLTQLPCSMLLSPKDSFRVSQILSSLDQSAGEGIAKRVAFQRLGLELVSIILENSPVTLIRSADSATDRVQEVLRFIRDHLHEPLSRKDLARQAHLSVTRFHYVFLEATGQAPMKYLMEQRIRRAGQLLLSTALSSQEIGNKCGFESPPHFSRMFARLTGISPLNYRLQARQAE